jgi:mannose-6-phosphate isomerase-like protein (cupin superfamily)
MMKNLILFILLLIHTVSFSQEITNLNTIQPNKEYENIFIKKLDTDSNATSFVIWIKKSVKSHKHETHSEMITVIEGHGLMTIDEKSFPIKSGDYFRIPKNTFHSLEVKSDQPVKVVSIQTPEFLGKDRIFKK